MQEFHWNAFANRSQLNAIRSQLPSCFFYFGIKNLSSCLPIVVLDDGKSKL